MCPYSVSSFHGLYGALNQKRKNSCAKGKNWTQAIIKDKKIIWA